LERPPPHKRRNPAAFAGRGVSQIGHLRASSTTTANAKSVARCRQTNSTGCHSVSLCKAACVPGFDRWGQDEQANNPPISRKNGAGFTQLERWLGEYDLLVLRRNHAAPMIVLPWRTWAALLMRGRR
jgi:hypothetical protein